MQFATTFTDCLNSSAAASADNGMLEVVLVENVRNWRTLFTTNLNILTAENTTERQCAAAKLQDINFSRRTAE
jgi:hypothetical protein